jgi:RhoGEF domain
VNIDPTGLQATTAPGDELDNGSFQKQQEARNKIITELYQTEVDYCSCLELCVATFLDAASSPWSADDKDTLFGTINSVVSLSRKLMTRLEVGVIQKPYLEQSVGK